MIDIHCHILPATDDGPRTWDETLRLCERAASDGITHIVATPHCSRRYPFDRAASQVKVDQLRTRFTEIQFSLGCELALTDESLERALEDPHEFTIGETSYMLVEPSEVYMPNQIEGAISQLISSGIVPILAHPERNPLLRRRLDLLETLISMGCLSALTGNSLSGFWGADIRKIAETMLRDDLGHFLVSDGHNEEARPILLADAQRAASRILGRERAHDLVWGNPSLVLNGEAVFA